MQLEVGKIYDGKITEIAKFGAFVEVEGKTGMVHISEISNTYVEEIKDHVKVGQEVKVKVINITEEGKISLSIKKALPQQENRQRRNSQEGQFRSNRDGRRSGNRDGRNGHQDKQGSGQQPNGGFGGNSQDNGYGGYRKKKTPQKGISEPPPLFDSDQPKDSNFEDMLNRFKQTSEEKFSDLKRITDNKRRTSARRK